MRNDNSGAPNNGSISNADENNISTRNSILGSNVEAEAVLSRSPNRKRETIGLESLSFQKYSYE